jgi:hypothetical protein
MNSAVCTLFEGSYHYGVGALANSLYAQGYRGVIYAGYRGDLPPWINGARAGGGLKDFSPAEGLTLRFIPLITKIHLTNYKPDFMLSLWQEQCPQAESLFYFDPDITVIGGWPFFESWVRSGAALCADVNPSMPPQHPLRQAWKQFYQPHGIVFRRELDMYFNGGFVGVHRQHAEFLRCWQKLQELMAPEIGGLQNVNVRDRTYLFHKTDQDALNVAAMCSESPICPIGQDGMDLQLGGGGYVMSHAVGGQKPWRKQFLKSVCLRGESPSRADRFYFRHVESPIRLYPAAALSFKRASLLTASMVGRFVRRGGVN